MGGDYFTDAAVANGVVYCGAAYAFYALDARTGIKLWGRPIAIGSGPAVANGLVYFGTDGGTVYALDDRTGAEVWTYKAGSTVDLAPAVANGVVYFGSYDGNLYALNASTGAKLWSYPTGDSDPIVVNGMVYIAYGDVYTFSLK